MMNLQLHTKTMHDEFAASLSIIIIIYSNIMGFPFFFCCIATVDVSSDNKSFFFFYLIWLFPV